MTKNFLRTWIIAAGLCAVPGLAQATEHFMLIQSPAVPGDSTAKGHENWIRVSSFDWNVVAASSWTSTGGASVGKPNPGKMVLTLPTGVWSPLFLRLITQGKALPKVVVDATATDGRPLYRMTIEGFFVTGYRLASETTTPIPQDHLEGVFKTVKLEYYATAADGRLITTTVDWNISTGVSSPPAF
jgi:type VI secretion system secreted protein Hcp